MNIISYLFAPPVSGPLLKWLLVIHICQLIVGIVAQVVSKRSGYAAVRKRARQLRSISLWAAVPGGVYLFARHFDIPVLNLRIWAVLIGVVFITRLAYWLLRLRSLDSDKIDERETRRKQSYFKRSKRKRKK